MQTLVFCLSLCLPLSTKHLTVSSSSDAMPTLPLPSPRGDVGNLPPFILGDSEGEEMEVEEWHLIEAASD
jgi:hypothetical protein